MTDAVAFDLRVPTESDALAYARLFDDPEVMRFVTGGPPQPLEQYLGAPARAEADLARFGTCRFAVVVDGETAGFCGIGPWSRDDWGPVGELEIGWRLGRSYQGRGLATAAARRVLATAPADLPSPTAVIEVGNAASGRVAAKLGMAPAERVTFPRGEGTASADVWRFQSAPVAGAEVGG